MRQVDKRDLNQLQESDAAASEFQARWFRLCETYLPFKLDGTFWRYSRKSEPGEPSQGWKLHVSATILQACDLFERVAPFLAARRIRFKAPESLKELINLNSGLKYGYWQVGKFLTVYPSTEAEAVALARELHELTEEFISITVPFDNQYVPNSSVFYRYGAFENIELTTEDGWTVPTVRNLSAELVPDDRLRAVPEWLDDPFRRAEGIIKNETDEAATPLATTYKVFRAIRQRGKGGTYQAVDLSTNPPRLCVVKEGRRHGEVFWNGQDGYHLVRNERRVLENLKNIYQGAPGVFGAFEAKGNFYLVMEYIDGNSLSNLMKHRRRRFSVTQVLFYSVEIARIVEKIHRAGWIWNDCKPANLIVTKDKSLRPIDFEGAYEIGRTAPFNWKSREFSKPGNNRSSAEADDFYALGAVIYFLLTGKFYDADSPTPVGKLRRRVPKQLGEIIAELLDAHASDKKKDASKIRRRLQKLFDSI